MPRITSEPATESSAVDGVASQSKECDAHGGLLIALGVQVTVRENGQYCDGRFLHESVYSTRIRALAPMLETVDGGGVGHEKRGAHDGISEMVVRLLYLGSQVEVSKKETGGMGRWGVHFRWTSERRLFAVSVIEWEGCSCG